MPDKIEPRRQTDTTVTRADRNMFLEYEADQEGTVTLEILRDVVHRTRNQHGVPKWSPLQDVEIRQSEFSVSFTLHEVQVVAPDGAVEPEPEAPVSEPTDG